MICCPARGPLELTFTTWKPPPAQAALSSILPIEMWHRADDDHDYYDDDDGDDNALIEYRLQVSLVREFTYI
jgi:hypothetical protein